MLFMDYIIQYLESARDWFYDAYLEVSGWISPFNALATPLYSLYVSFFYLAYYFGEFNDWLIYVQNWVTQILSWDTIWSFITQYVPNILSIRDWYYDWWSHVSDVVDSFWSFTQYTVQNWIDAAVAPFQAVADAWNDFWVYTWPDLVSSFNDLRVTWYDFWNNIYPELVSFAWLESWWSSQTGGINELINSAFALRADLWEGWLDIKDQVLTFFQYPLDWLWERFADWFLGTEV